MPENRSCPEFIPKTIISSNYEELTVQLVNCANCKRWNIDKQKCREEIWLIEWIKYLVEKVNNEQS